MKIKVVIFLLLLFNACILSVTHAQNRCSAVDFLQYQIQHDPSFKERYESLLFDLKNKATVSTDSFITIPVVVHVLYHTDQENVSDEQIKSGIDVINEDYSTLNATFLDIPTTEWNSVLKDSHIRFRLAVADPNGKLTSGVTRTFTNKSSFPLLSPDIYDSLNGGYHPWPSNAYMNIWICTLENNGLGYASFPGTDPASDGVIISNKAFGRNGLVKSPYDLGRTLSHEIGHWLSLYHIWGDDNGTCSGNDFFGIYAGYDDTPLQANYHFRCPKFPETDSCTAIAPGVMYMNYMDYTDDKCMMFFTAGQQSVMHQVLDNARSTIKSSQALTYAVRPDYDVSIDSVLAPVRLSGNRCFTPIIRISNNGNRAVSHIGVQYGIYQGVQKLYWVDDTILPQHQLTVSLSEMSSDLGNQIFEAKLIIDDAIHINNYASSSFKMSNAASDNCSGSGITLYPNPVGSTSSVCMKVKSNQSQKATISIVNSLGQTVFKEENILLNPLDAVSLNLKGFATGVYFVRVEGDSYKATSRLIYLPEKTTTQGSDICN